MLVKIGHIWGNKSNFFHVQIVLWYIFRMYTTVWPQIGHLGLHIKFVFTFQRCIVFIEINKFNRPEIHLKVHRQLDECMTPQAFKDLFQLPLILNHGLFCFFCLKIIFVLLPPRLSSTFVLSPILKRWLVTWKHPIYFPGALFEQLSPRAGSLRWWDGLSACKQWIKRSHCRGFRYGFTLVFPL